MDTNTYNAYAADTIQFGNINKSPVLYLRRRRDIDYNRPFEGDRESVAVYRTHLYSEHSEYDSDESNEPIWKVDKGDIYPNHNPKFRHSGVEWVKFRDFKKRYPVKWIRKQQLIIDGDL
jgi:hypothetical protein